MHATSRKRRESVEKANSEDCEDCGDCEDVSIIFTSPSHIDSRPRIMAEGPSGSLGPSDPVRALPIVFGHLSIAKR